MKFKIKKSYYRLFSVLLSVVMIVLSVPFSATAQESTENETDLIASIGGPYGQDHTETPTQKSPEVLAADAEAMRREQLIQNGIDPDQPLSNNSTAQLVQGGEELQPLADYPQVLSGGDGVYAIKHLRGNYFIKTEHPEWLAGYHMQQQYTSSSTIMNNFSTGYLFKLTQHPDTGSYIIRLMYNNALSFSITPKSDGSGYEVLTKDIQLDDALVPLSDTYVISVSGSGFKIRKYGTTNCIAVNGSQTNLTATTEIGDRIRWTFTQYTGAERNSAVMLYSSLPTVGQTTTLIPVIYSTRPGYNMPHLDMSQIPSSSYYLSGPNEYGRFSLTPHDGPDWTFHIYVKNASLTSSPLVYASEQDFKIKLPIDEGTYFFNNVKYDDKFMQIDDDVSNSTNGAIMELWDFDGEDDQKWALDHLADGYYKITSVASGKALTMTTETDGSVTQTDYTENFNQLWLISQNSNGTYSLYSYVFYLAAGDGTFTSDGRNVEGRAAQSDGKDEWILCQNDTSILLAIEDTDLWLRDTYFSSTKNNLQTQKNGMVSKVSTVKYSAASVTDMINYLKSSDIFIIHTHGSQTSFKIATSGTKSITLWDLSNQNLSNLSFALLMTCDTGLNYNPDHITNNAPVNIVEQMVICGAETVIGFSGETTVIDCNKFAPDITEKIIEEGLSIKNAVNSIEYGFYIKNMANLAVIAGNENKKLR